MSFTSILTAVPNYGAYYDHLREDLEHSNSQVFSQINWIRISGGEAKVLIFLKNDPQTISVSSSVWKSSPYPLLRDCSVDHLRIPVGRRCSLSLGGLTTYPLQAQDRKVLMPQSSEVRAQERSLFPLLFPLLLPPRGSQSSGNLQQACCKTFIMFISN